MFAQITQSQAMKRLKDTNQIVFLTGAGVSTPSGIPDYRSMKGIYHDLERPEYLLSHTCMVEEPVRFYEFVKKMYHPAAKPNAIHRQMARLEQRKPATWVISQNIDGLHALAGSQQLVNFHGSLYECSCRACGRAVPWKAYLNSDRHKGCGGQVRPNVVLYEEGLSEDAIATAISAVSRAELIVIVGTSFQVHPFCDLIFYAQPDTKILVINQEPIPLQQPYQLLQGDALTIFKQMEEE